MKQIQTQLLDHDLAIPKRYNTHDLIKAVKTWFKKYHLDDDSHYVLTKQKQKICFTAISEWHLVFDVVNSRSKLVAQALTYLPEVFESGEYKCVQKSNKDRSNKRAKFTKFHTYTKKVVIGDHLVTIRAKAGEYPTGKIVILPKLTAYTFATKEKRLKDATNLLTRTEQQGTSTQPIIKSLSIDSVSSFIYDNALFNSMQDESTFEIIEIEAIQSETQKELERLFYAWF